MKLYCSPAHFTFPSRTTVITVVHERSHRSTSRFAVFCLSLSRFISLPFFPFLYAFSLSLSLIIVFERFIFRFNSFRIVILFSCICLTCVCVCVCEWVWVSYLQLLIFLFSCIYREIPSLYNSRYLFNKRNNT